MTASIPRVPPSPALIAQILGQLAFGLVAMTLCIPSMPEWSLAFDTTPATVQLTFSGYVAAYGLLQLVYGPLSDRLGRRRVLLTGLTIALCGTLLAALAHDITTLVVARTLQGAGTAAGMVVGRALVQDFFEGTARTRMMAGIGMTMGLCPPAGTLIGGQLHEALGWRAPFWLTLAIGLLLTVTAWRVLLDPQVKVSVSTDTALEREGSELAPVAGVLKDLILLAEGCKIHRAYRAKQAPKGECPTCWSMWEGTERLRLISNAFGGASDAGA